MLRLLCLLILCTSFATPVAAQQTKPVLAIFSIENKGSALSPEEVDNLSDYLSTKLGERGLFQIVPRSEIRKRLVGQKQESYKECYDEACQVELGRELAAEQSLSTSISRVGSKCLLQANLYDLKRAASIKGASAKRNCDVDAMITGVEELAAKLDGSWKAPRTAEPKPEATNKIQTTPRLEVRQAPPVREKHVWAALLWSLLPGGGLYYTNHVGWGVTYSVVLGLGGTASAFMASEEAGMPVLIATMTVWGLSMLHASIAALVWDDPDQVAALRDFRPVDQKEHAASGDALLFPVWQTRF